MKRVNLDSAPGDVQEFVRSLSINDEGVELDTFRDTSIVSPAKFLRTLRD